ncbi:MAG: hypothetical protein LBK29_00270 [Oscillospiraceae bacterium]|jgi:hypothetical protein|nr:hypothetical protein [Oscillospiraceae bacterium]
MCEKDNCIKFLMVLSSVFLGIFAVGAAIFVILERKKKKDDEELESYLENSIQ